MTSETEKEALSKGEGDPEVTAQPVIGDVSPPVSPTSVEVPVWSKENTEVNNAMNSPDQGSQDRDPDSAHISATTPAYTSQVDLVSLKDTVFFMHDDLYQRLSRFWILLLLAAVIATSGIVSDSAATVIGAMIVAPLMTPILGTMLSIVLTDGANFLMSITLCLSGIGSCILVGYLYGQCVNYDLISKENNSQIAGRVQPKIPDLIGAIATGLVGAICLVRKDIAGALPGVAISISLVPPLCVAGLVGSKGETLDMVGALLLFLTNFLSIQVTGIVVMYAYKVHKMAARRRARLSRNMAFILVLCLGVLAVPLAGVSRTISRELEAQHCVKEATNDFFSEDFPDWETKVVIARVDASVLRADITAAGPPPIPQLQFTSMRGAVFEDVDGYPFAKKVKECDVDYVSILYLPKQNINIDEICQANTKECT